MVQYIFTPWRDRRELLAVRSQFYPEHQHRTQQTRSHSTHLYHLSPSSDQIRREQQDEKQKAVARVSMWMQRGGCPHMVESTALLTAAILSDEGGEERDGSARALRGYAVRAAYSAAFSRFVTGLLDSHQDKQRKMSMYDVAKTVGLPATFVELRHQATHEQLPSLTRLRSAARKALDWIWGYYWAHVSEVDALPAASLENAERAGNVDQDGVEGGSSKEEREVRAWVGRYLFDGKEEAKGEMGRYEEGLVLTVLDSVSGSTRDSKVLRRAVALAREIMQRGGDAERMEEDERPGEGVVKDVESVRAELGRAWEEVRELEEEGVVEDEDEEMAEAETAEDRPAWSLYEEEAWVPKPIGVV